MSYYEDNLYHSAYSDGYLDGYYAGMELYHSDDEMTEEERKAKARRGKRRRALAVALGVTGGAAGYAVGRALRKKGGPRLAGPRPRPTGGSSRPRPTGGPTGPRLTGPILKRVHVPDYDVEEPNGWDFKRNKPTYRSDKLNEEIYKSYNDLKKYREYDHDAKKWKYRTGTIYDTAF